LAAHSDAMDIEDVPTPLYMNPVFYYSMAACIGAMIVWGIQEPYFDDGAGGIPYLSDYLLFGPVAGAIGLFIGMAYGISNRNFIKAVYCGVIGLGIGLAATLLTTFMAEMVYGTLLQLAVAMSGVRPPFPENFQLTGIAFFILICGRGLGWSLVSIGSGFGLGVALKSKKLMFNGVVGGMIGGLLGGFLFDPVSRFLCTDPGNAALSRAIGIGAVGLLVGLFTGLIENASKEAWFIMQKGVLAGKQFVLFKSPTVIGSSPKAEIYLFKDAAIQPRHAEVLKSGAKYVLKTVSADSEVFVNGRAIDSTILQNGDIISMGETVLKYSEKETR
ncbi:FHA domain-containing protein, partial [Planctomycetota bacterium]